MYRIELILSVIDQAVETKKRRHIIGGILTSMAALFGGLAATVFTSKGESDE